MEIGAFGHRPDGQLAPVPYGQIVDQVGSCVDDPLARLGDALAAYRAVIATPR
jgi:hypothetical protein